QTVYNSWVAFRKLHFDIAELHRKALASQVDVYLFIGKYDKLLKAENVKQLSALLPASKYLLLPSGHAQLVEKAAIQLKKHFGDF
ncbi:MAG TPA: hypothetical protein VGN64_22835, partial [Dyadobacter sp.]|nr:hypothetical protein [Dyadobacter sp.]